MSTDWARRAKEDEKEADRREKKADRLRRDYLDRRERDRPKHPNRRD